MKVLRLLPYVAIALYLLMVLRLYSSTVGATGGHFLYSLDDPYIHLALAESLAHGHYGINAGEYSSPSSSLAWPFLLIPGAGRPWHMYVPLVWNLLFGACAAALIGTLVARWPPRRYEAGRMPLWQQALTTLLLLFAANLPGLTMLGMEHVLQVLLAICCAFGMASALGGDGMPLWCIAAAIFAPSVRYEDLALTLAVAMTLAGLRRWRAAALTLALSLLPLAAFSLFLRSKGLPALPLSVLTKGGAYGHASSLARLAEQFKGNIHSHLTDPTHYPIVLLTLTFVGLCFKAGDRIHRFIFAAAGALGVLQLGIGRFGWSHRYEVYASIFLVLIFVRLMAERPRFSLGYYFLGLLFCSSVYIRAATANSLVAAEVYYQQYQMHRFVTGFYTGNYAVNDLGLVSFQRRPGAFVLDLYGLASPEASRHHDRSAPWLEDVVQRYQTPLAMVYPEWFHVPATWTPLATMCNPDGPLVIAKQCMVFYSTAARYDAGLRAQLQQFAPTLPKEVTLTMGPVWPALPIRAGESVN